MRDKHGRAFYVCDGLTDSKVARGACTHVESTASDANLIGSELENGMHKPVIDLDFPCQLIPSSTLGHFHLYIDKEIPRDAMFALLDTMVAVGLVQKGFRDGCLSDGMTMIRPSWVKKEETKLPSDVK